MSPLSRFVPVVRLRFIVFVLSACLSLSKVTAQLPVIELSAISRVCGHVGSEFEMRASVGNRLDEVTGLLFSQAGIEAELLTDSPLPFQEQQQPKYGHFRVKIAATVPPGRYECRAIGRHGISNPKAFLVHAFPTDILDAPGTSRSKPLPLTVGQVVHGKSGGAQRHYFSIQVEPRSAIRVDCLAANVDSQMIPTLTVFDSAGRTLHSRHGSDQIDPFVMIDSFDGGVFVIEVHDMLYRGGEIFPYLLVAQNAATAIDIIPQQADTDETQLPRSWFPHAVMPADHSHEEIRVEETSDAKSVSPPSRIRADFDTRDDEDAYTFTANKDDQLAIDLVSHRLGEPTDSRIIVEQQQPQPSGDPKWVTLSNGDDSQNIGDGEVSLRTTDPYVFFKAPADATYRVTVRDLDNGTSLREQQQYILDLRRPDPGFELVAYRPFPAKDQKSSRQHGSHLFRGGTESLRVLCLRRDGWKGPIHLSVEGLPAGVTCAPATIAANQDRCRLTLVAAEAAAAGIASIKVVGTADVGGKAVQVTAAPAVIQFGRGNSRDFIRARRSTGISIAVAEHDVAPLSIAVGDNKIAEVKKGESLTIPVKLTRREGGKANCVLRAKEFPPKITCGDLTINADKSDGNLTVKIAGDAPTGTYSLSWYAETKIKIKPNPQALAREEAYRNRLNKLKEDPANAAQQDAINQAIKASDERVKAAQGSAKEQELTIFPPTPHLTIRVVEAK